MFVFMFVFASVSLSRLCLCEWYAGSCDGAQLHAARLAAAVAARLGERDSAELCGAPHSTPLRVR